MERHDIKQRDSIHILIELAKYYEHKVKDIPKAIEMTNKALEVSLKLGIDNSVSIHKTNLKADLKKVDRLMRKAGIIMQGVREQFAEDNKNIVDERNNIDEKMQLVKKGLNMLTIQFVIMK